MYTYTYIYIYTLYNICMYVCTYIYIYIEVDSVCFILSCFGLGFQPLSSPVFNICVLRLSWWVLAFSLRKASAQSAGLHEGFTHG